MLQQKKKKQRTKALSKSVQKERSIKRTAKLFRLDQCEGARLCSDRVQEAQRTIERVVNGARSSRLSPILEWISPRSRRSTFQCTKERKGSSIHGRRCIADNFRVERCSLRKGREIAGWSCWRSLERNGGNATFH